MTLSPMRYKDYVWPYNPERCSVRWERKIAMQKAPYGGCYLQDLGLTCRVMRGEGTFTGAGAYDEFRALTQVFSSGGPGVLVHPVWQASNAYFVSLELAEEPLPDYVHYQFEFWEDGAAATGLTEIQAVSAGSSSAAAAQSQSAAVYTVKRGDNLWAIAQRYGVTLGALLGANPQIKNPNLIYPGDRVVIP